MKDAPPPVKRPLRLGVPRFEQEGECSGLPPDKVDRERKHAYCVLGEKSEIPREENVKKLIMILVVLALPAAAQAHPGGRDAYGGHYDSATDEYHVHEGPLEGRTYKSQENMLRVLRQTRGGPAMIKRAEQGNAPGKKPAQQTTKQQRQKKEESDASPIETILRELMKDEGKK
jgi:hypothetical protein